MSSLSSFRVDLTSMKQTLLYIYGGVIETASNCSLGHLTQLADMLQLDGLKEVVAFNLNLEYCHFFHRVRQHLLSFQD